MLKIFLRDSLRPAFLLLLFLTLLLGGLYPALVTAIAQMLFPAQAAGSVILVEGKPAGSALIGQQFSDPKYFWGRVSATSPAPYHAGASAGSNLGAGDPALLARVKQRVELLKKSDPKNTRPIPVDLVTASASGLDPHISPAAAEYQLRRVAKLRKMKEPDLRALVQAHTEARQFGILGEPRVNVLKLNLALDKKL